MTPATPPVRRRPRLVDKNLMRSPPKDRSSVLSYRSWMPSDPCALVGNSSSRRQALSPHQSQTPQRHQGDIGVNPPCLRARRANDCVASAVECIHPRACRVATRGSGVTVRFSALPNGQAVSPAPGIWLAPDVVLTWTEGRERASRPVPLLPLHPLLFLQMRSSPPGRRIRQRCESARPKVLRQGGTCRVPCMGNRSVSKVTAEVSEKRHGRVADSLNFGGYQESNRTRCGDAPESRWATMVLRRMHRGWVSRALLGARAVGLEPRTESPTMEDETKAPAFRARGPSPGLGDRLCD